MKNFSISALPEKSAHCEQSRYVYHHVVGESGRDWFYPADKCAGDMIHCSSLKENSQGYGGSILTFPLVDGSIFKVRGPWHSNSRALLADTGIDLTKNHNTYVVISKEYSGRGIMVDVIFQDEDWVEGDFNRGRKLALAYAKEFGKVYLSSYSSGGSSHGWVYDTDKPYWRK